MNRELSRAQRSQSIPGNINTIVSAHTRNRNNSFHINRKQRSRNKCLNFIIARQQKTEAQIFYYNEMRNLMSHSNLISEKIKTLRPKHQLSKHILEIKVKQYDNSIHELGDALLSTKVPIVQLKRKIRTLKAIAPLINPDKSALSITQIKDESVIENEGLLTIKKERKPQRTFTTKKRNLHHPMKLFSTVVAKQKPRVNFEDDCKRSTDSSSNSKQLPTFVSQRKFSEIVKKQLGDAQEWLNAIKKKEVMIKTFDKTPKLLKISDDTSHQGILKHN